MNLGPQETAREEASLAAIEEGSGEDGEGAPGEGPATSPIRVPCEEDIVGYETIVITIIVSIFLLKSNCCVYNYTLLRTKYVKIKQQKIKK